MSKVPQLLGMSKRSLADLVDPAMLQTHIANRVVSRRAHPVLPLAILNYTQKATFDQIWDAVTIRCRGLIYNFDTEEVVAIPFAKFFNYDTNYRTETLPENLPTFEPEITQKLDGSLGILYRHGDFTGIATRGSFASDQAAWASAWLTKHLPAAEWPEGWTPLFEVIYPDNRVVVKYDYEGLTLIGCVNNETGEEMRHDQLESLGNDTGCRVVNLINKQLLDCREENRDNEEGYVATWHFDDGPPLKVKIKFATYFNLHRLLTTTSPKRIWEYLRDGTPLDELIEHTPEHFKGWVNGWKYELEAEFGRLESTAKAIYAGRPNTEVRKESALYFTEESRRKYSGICFAMLDGKDYGEAIWKIVREKTRDYEAFRGNDE